MTEAVKVVSRRALFRREDVPEPLKEWAKARGLRLSWQFSDPASFAMLVGSGFEAITREMVVQIPGMEEWLRPGRGALWFDAEGRISRDGAILCLLSQEDFDAMQAETGRIWSVRKDESNRLLDILAENIRNINAGGQSPDVTRLDNPQV